MLNQLINIFLRKSSPPPQELYFAEFDTDKVVRELFYPDRRYKGLIVEVGGGTPSFLSMSKHFKDAGWRSIVVEPNPMFASQHRAAGNEVFECACSNRNADDAEFTVVSQSVSAMGGIITDHAFSSISLKPAYASLLPSEAQLKTISVDLRRLDSLLLSIGVSSIDILSFDVEGWELEVMQGLDTSQIRCRVVILENFAHDPAYSRYMESRDYYLRKVIEYNYIYSTPDCP